MNTLVLEPLPMCPPSGFASQPAVAGADTFGLRPLSAIAATGGGGVPQARIRRILADLVEPLTALHDQGRVHGAISTSTIGLDESGTAHLRVPATEGGANAEHASRAAGFAAFEQYSDDPDLVCGPWTDIYALSAVACSLITGSPPPDALARRVRDVYVPLAERLPEGYDAAFLRGIDAGLAMAAARRPGSMQAYVQRLSLPEVAAVPAVVEPEVILVREDYFDDEDDEPEDKGHKRKRHLILWLSPLVIAVLAWFFWIQGQGGPGSRVARTGSGPLLAQAGAGMSATGAGETDPSAISAPAPPPSPSTSISSSSSSPASDSTAIPAATGAAANMAYPIPAETHVQIAGKAADPAPAGAGPVPADSNSPAMESAAQATTLATTQVTTGTAIPAGQASDAKPVGPEPFQSSVVLGGGAVKSTPALAGGASGAGATPAASAARLSRTAVQVRVDVRPWGEVLVDGVSQGVSPPLKELKLAPGKYRVAVRNTGMPSYSTTLEVKAGTPITISHVFQ